MVDPDQGNGLDQPPAMDPPEKLPLDKDELPPRLSRIEEARQIIEEYAADLRQVIKKLRRRLN